MEMARMASESQTLSQANCDAWRAANTAAARAVMPRRTCPQPETAVKAAERSMVSRMKRRSSANLGSKGLDARVLTEWRARRMRCGRGSNIALG